MTICSVFCSLVSAESYLVGMMTSHSAANIVHVLQLESCLCRQTTWTNLTKVSIIFQNAALNWSQYFKKTTFFSFLFYFFSCFSVSAVGSWNLNLWQLFSLRIYAFSFLYHLGLLNCIYFVMHHQSKFLVQTYSSLIMILKQSVGVPPELTIVPTANTQQIGLQVRHVNDLRVKYIYT